MEAQRWKDLARIALFIFGIVAYVELRLMPWQEVWQTVFIVASAMFYIVVAVVAFKGFGDVTRMMRNMSAGQGASESAAEAKGR